MLKSVDVNLQQQGIQFDFSGHGKHVEMSLKTRALAVTSTLVIRCRIC